MNFTGILVIHAFQYKAVPGTFTGLKWSLVPPDFKEGYMKIVQILIIKKSTTCK